MKTHGISEHQLEQLHQRLSLLEKKNSRLQRLIASLFMVGLSMLLLGQSTPKYKKTLEAQEIVLYSPDGRIGLRLAPTTNTKGLILRNGDKKAFAMISNSSAHGTQLDLIDEGEGRAILSTGTGLHIRGADGRMRAELNTLSNESTRLSLASSRQGSGHIELTTSAEGGSSLAFYDSPGNMRVMLGRTSDSSTLQPDTSFLLLRSTANGAANLRAHGEQVDLKLKDFAGYSSNIGSATLESVTTGEGIQRSAASIVLFHKDNRVLWSTP